jgi:hypothetical protein
MSTMYLFNFRLLACIACCQLGLLGCAGSEQPAEKPKLVAVPPWVGPANGQAVWSVAELERHTEVAPSQQLWLEGYVVILDNPECRCLPDAACAPCAYDVFVGDTPNAPARKVVQVALPGDVGLKLGARYQFSIMWNRWEPQPELLAFGVAHYMSHHPAQ